MTRNGTNELLCCECKPSVDGRVTEAENPVLWAQNNTINGPFTPSQSHLGAHLGSAPDYRTPRVS
jgi:hypothetical protein